jgi:predicted nucleotide-binding protein (sugar kinase/HSP70/actin superfamily)
LFREDLRFIAREFEKVELTGLKKPRVGLVGEILVKYHPAANNDMARFLESEGAEIAVPGLTEFFLYCAYGKLTDPKFLSGSRLKGLLGRLCIWLIESYRDDMRSALAGSRFKPPKTIHELAESVSPLISLCNRSGEGWLLTAEMKELLEEGASNILCMQPFACLPNHITGKGMLKTLKELYPAANITAIDYDPGASLVNQENRIRLMLERAKEQLE